MMLATAQCSVREFRVESSSDHQKNQKNGNHDTEIQNQTVVALSLLDYQSAQRVNQIGNGLNVATVHNQNGIICSG